MPKTGNVGCSVLARTTTSNYIHGHILFATVFISGGDQGGGEYSSGKKCIPPEKMYDIIT